MKMALLRVRNVGIHTVCEGLRAWRVTKMKNLKHACSKCILTIREVSSILSYVHFFKKNEILLFLSKLD